LIATLGPVEIVVINPGNVASNKAALVINGCPAIDSLVPPEAIAGGPDFILTINGSGFEVGFAGIPDVLWNGQRLTVLSSSGMPLSVRVPASLIATENCAFIRVVTFFGSSQPVKYCAVAGPSFVGPSISPAGPGDQPTLDFGITAPYSMDIDVMASLTFKSDAVAQVDDDPAIQLTCTDRTVTCAQLPPQPPAIRQIKFTIVKGKMNVPISVPIGTVAGTIAIDIVAQVNGSIADVGKVSIMIPRSPPVIRGSSLTFTPTGFEVAITGFSPERAMEKAFFQFNAPPGSNQFPDITIDVAAIFAAYYQGESSKKFGSVFTYKQAFTLEDAASAIRSVTVRLKNSLGDSNSWTTN